MIISGGENIYSRRGGSSDFGFTRPLPGRGVIGVTDERWGEAVQARSRFWRGACGHRGGADQALPKTQIASYKKPKSVVFVADLPRLPSGKINKVTLRQLYGSADVKETPHGG